jgi:hypothetical protein
VEGYTTFGRTAREVQSKVYRGCVLLEVHCVIRRFYYEWKKKLTDYYQLDNSVDFEEKRKVSSELTLTSEEVGSKINFCNINCTRF